MDARRGASGWAWGALALVGMAAVSVFFAFDALPFMDLPAHAGLFALRARYATSPFEQRFYVLAPHIGGYSMFRFVGGALTSVMGPLHAARALEAAGVVMLPVALVDARRRLYGRASVGFGFLGIALGFGLMTIFGFASFLLGMALLLECTAIGLELLAKVDAGEQAWSQEIALAVVAVLLLLTHGFAFAIFLGVAGTAAIARPGPGARFVRARALVPAVALAVYAVWLERPSTLPSGSVPAPQPRVGPLFQSLADKLSLLLTPTLLTRTGVDIAVGLLVWGVAIGGVVSTVGWLRRTRREAVSREVQRAVAHARALLACLLLLCCAFLILPHEIGWFGFIDGRLVPVIVLYALLCVPDVAMGRRFTLALRWLAPPAASVLVALALVASGIFQREAAGYREVFARVPTQARVLNLPIDPDSDVFAGHPFVHYDMLMVAQRPLLVSDVWLHQGSAIFPRQGNPVLRLPADYRSSDIRRIDWPAFALADWDYVLLRTKPKAPPPATPQTLRLTDHVGGWWLYSTDGRSDFGR
ncbi:MAG: hypothetical protein ACLP1X_26250 [Polyangiaceae bacterium]